MPDGIVFLLLQAQTEVFDWRFWLWVAMIVAALAAGVWAILHVRGMAGGRGADIDDLSLEDLKSLHERGSISRVEYEAARTVVLRRIKSEQADMMKSSDSQSAKRT